MKSNENYYDIQIKATKKNNKAIVPPRRINSQSSIADMCSNASKRPSDYYIKKLSSSSVNLAKRPISGDSIVSLNSTYSDDISVNSSSFDHHDSRLSSMTSNSIISPSDSPTLKSHSGKADDGFNHSLSTITDDAALVEDSIAESSFRVQRNVSIKSTNTIASSAFSSSSLTLTRTKTKYLSQEEIKTRQKLRKKQFDDSYLEDDILSSDLSFVFNVPVMKSQSELYFKKTIRKNLVDDDHYKPFPLPGKLRSNSTPNLKPLNTSSINVSDSVIEEDESQGTIDDDSQIVDNISNYYSQRSKSYSKLVQMSRHENMMFKLPAYVKSQSSIEDLNLISPEKLNFVDQTRPIYLPPKPETDKAKHNKEMQKMLKDFERSSFTFESSHESDWSSLINDKNFARRVVNEKNIIRKMNWDSNCPESLRYEYLVSLLTYNNPDLTKKVDDNFTNLNSVYSSLNDSIKRNRNIEFEKVVKSVSERPLFSSNLSLASNLTRPDSKAFKKNFLTILFLKSIDNNLHKHDETFLIPVIVLLFKDRSTQEQFRLIELINHQIFTKELKVEVNKTFERWSSKLPKKIDNYLQNFNLKEFTNLDFNRFFEVLIQFNDRLPLSMSASLPSTPVSAGANRHIDSCSLELIYKFLQLLIIYNVNSKTKIFNHTKIIQSYLIIIIKYYHINWNDFNELIKLNKSIKLNFNTNNSINLNNFNDKWKVIFKNI
ncbi:hypothetical protein CANTEDRAFT_119393 [Yamadazyma tenuis ATCC 10573]|uniref:SBE2/SBE22 middle domain-containing protein n=1 Tax=Candida tenuis (strain ATCC 10573 / BCRC 21748 / CBS 615 / JCM 9827 / NBRC 10315 / NRRL Y-1498 / VKM Y-70) TaxID=590646 RepID=G3AZW4_CANTC|nr:uncharacterized protein CANTEDRAFT_119393 [Yamadazyma tenuis ATCC 10573]EGV65256.1 hypothetical protein CANTEDRAFT_119393 [Yamadazyma tenuis ATCC 10573]